MLEQSVKTAKKIREAKAKDKNLKNEHDKESQSQEAVLQQHVYRH